ncbi:MAG: PDZ domain-containing protein, partial [Candidatus Acidiferrales bacterium]
MFLHTENRWHSLTLAFLLLFAAALPHSIAAAQTAVGLAAAVWLAGLAIQRRRPARSDLDIPILLFVAASILAAVFSLEPAVSVAKLKATCLMLLIPLTADAVRNRRQAALLVGVLLGSATVGAAPVVWEKIVGRGVEVLALEETSPLRRAGVLPSDIVLACNGEEINRPQELRTLLSTHKAAGALVCQAMRGGILPYEFRLRAEWLREAA